MQQAEAVVKTTLQAAILLILFINCTSHVFLSNGLLDKLKLETHPNLSQTGTKN